MRKIKFLIPIATLLIVMFSCDNEDDGVIVIPPHERSDEVIVAQEEVEEYLDTHFYNYEEFENPPVDFNYRIVFDTISGENSSRTPLTSQVTFKMVTDLIDENVEYKLYYLNVRQGEGERAEFTDVATLSYEGTILKDALLIDSSISPITFDLTQVIKGLQKAIIEFNGATGFTENPDGTLTFDDYGIGAVFVPSGLGYYNTPPNGSPIEYYAQLIFTFHLYSKEKSDQDLDTVLSSFEDLNGNGNELDDDTDANGIPNFADPDDDGDGRLTKYEVEAKEYELNPGDTDPVLEENEVEMQRKTNEDTGVVTVYTVVFTDANNDGVADYLDNEL
ncbi:MAG: hypothetical protein ACI93P_001928 [bacterium]|jgi:hypothetical protein